MTDQHPDQGASAPVPPMPTDEEIIAFWSDHCAGDGDAGILRLARWGNTTPQPVPVSERLPGPEDCLDEGWAWFFNPRTGWRQASQPVHSTYTHWLPAHALPTPGDTP